MTCDFFIGMQERKETKTNFSAPEASYRPEDILHPLIDRSSEVVVDFGTVFEKPDLLLGRLGIETTLDGPKIRPAQSGSKFEESRKTPAERDAIIARQKKQGVRVSQKSSVDTWLKEQEAQGFFMTPAHSENLSNGTFFSWGEDSEGIPNIEPENNSVDSVNLTQEVQVGYIFEPDDDEKHITAEEVSRDFDDFEEYLDDGLYFQDSGVVAKPHSISAEDADGFHVETVEDLDPEKEHILFERDNYAFHDHEDEIFVPENPPIPEEDPSIDAELLRYEGNTDPLVWKMQADTPQVIVGTNGYSETKHSLEEPYDQESSA